jgi:hypothetical protein
VIFCRSVKSHALSVVLFAASLGSFAHGQTNTNSSRAPSNATQTADSDILPGNDPPKPIEPGQPANQQHEQAAKQLKQEEHQRILGVVPNFNTTFIHDAAPLSAKQKFQLAWKSSTDPVVFATAGVDAGLSQLTNDFPQYHQGMEGYAKRFGASYADTFDGSLWGNAILPTVLHQDPRYFRLGTGTIRHRLLYAIATTVICKGDNGKWQPSYSNVLGNMIAGGISNLYYPASERGVRLAYQRATTVTVEGALGAVFAEFWPDISKKLFNKKYKP